MARIITYLIFAGFTGMMLYVGITQFLQQRRSMANATPIDATIVRSEVITSTSSDTDSRLLRSNSTTSHRPEVRFRYVVAGQRYESDRMYPTIIVQGYASAGNAAAELAPYPVNARVRAWVDPSHPEQAFLIAERSKMPLGFIVIGLLLPPLGWITGKYV